MTSNDLGDRLYVISLIYSGNLSLLAEIVSKDFVFNVLPLLTSSDFFQPFMTILQMIMSHLVSIRPLCIHANNSVYECHHLSTTEEYVFEA